MSTKKSDYFLITGDAVPSKDVTNAYKENGLGEFKKLFENASEVIVNLEAPVTDNKNKSLKSGPSLKSSSNDAHVLKGINASIACMANNHICDYGAKGLSDTVKFLKKAGITPVGVVVNDLKFDHQIIEINKNKIAIFNFCEEEFCSIDENNKALLIEPCENFNHITSVDADFKIVILHAGTEHYHLPNPWHRKVSKYFIDIGADLVVSHHTHKVSGYEIYKNKFIYYGLGNFLFSNKAAPESWNTGMLLIVCIENGELKVVRQGFKQLDKSTLVRPLTISEKDNFTNYIDDINVILGNHKLYQDSWSNYLETNDINYTAALFGMSRMERGLYRRIGVKFPMFEKRSKFLRISNYVNCSSHKLLLNASLKKLIRDVK